MNRSNSRFVSHSRPAYSAHPVKKCTHAKRQGRSGKAYWFPIVTMMAAILFAVSTVMPRSVFDAFAAGDGTYSLSITANTGAFSVLLTGDFDSSEVNVSPNAGATEASGDSVKVIVNMTEAGSVTITAPKPMTSVEFGTGAQNITDLNLDASGTSTLDISGCTALTELDLQDNEDLSASAYEIVYGNRSNFAVLLAQTGFTHHEQGGTKGYLFDVPGAGPMENQTATVADQTIAKSGDQYFLTYDNLAAAFAEDNANAVLASSTGNPGVVFSTIIYHANFPEYIDPDESDSTTEPAGDGDDTQTSTTTGGSDSELPEGKLAIEKGSKSIIKDADIETHDDLDTSKMKIIAKALSKTDKSNFVAAIKKADKNFKETDPSLIYNIYVVGSDGKKVDLKDKADVTVTLAFPSDEVRYNREEYTFKVYHQLADKSIDTSIDPSANADGIQITTDSFSNFAISCSAKEQNYTNIPVDADSKKNGYAVSAKAHEGTAFQYEDGTDFTGTSYKIVVEKPGDKDKKAFLAEVKKADKDFDDTDKNLLVYDIYLVDSEGEKLELKSGKVEVMLAYPNTTVKKNYAKYDHKVYHKHDDAIDTAQLAVGKKDGIVLTSNSFSMFAVTSVRNSSNGVPQTGESSVSTNIALLLGMLSIASFAGVYAKRKAEQY